MASSHKYNGVPRYPPHTLRHSGELDRLFKKLNKGRFSQGVIAAFRKPVCLHWAEQYWHESATKHGETQQKQTAMRLKVPESYLTDLIEPGMPIMLTYLFFSEDDWCDLPKLNWCRELAIECYTAAIEYAAERHAQSEGTNGRENSLSRSEFAGLLCLYQCDEWFESQATEVIGDANTRAQCTHRRDALAEEISAAARAFNGDLSESTAFDRLALERLQATWGYGWILAIDRIPYHWDLSK